MDAIKKVVDEIVKKLPKECRLVSNVEVNEIYLALEEECKKMLIDCGCPRSMIGRKQLEAYLKSQGFAIENLQTKESLKFQDLNLVKLSMTAMKL